MTRTLIDADRGLQLTDVYIKLLNKEKAKNVVGGPNWIKRFGRYSTTWNNEVGFKI